MLVRIGQEMVECYDRGTTCRKCPFKCKPCLPVEEVNWEAGNLCGQCHARSVDNHNRQLYKKAGREYMPLPQWSPPPMSDWDKLQQALRDLERQLRSMGVKV